MHTSLVLFFALVCLPQIAMAQSAANRTVLTEAEFNNASQRLQQEVLNNPDKFIVVKDGQKVDVWNTDNGSSEASQGTFSEKDLLEKAISEGKISSKEEMQDAPDLNNAMNDPANPPSEEEKAASMQKAQNSLEQRAASTEEIMEETKWQMLDDQERKAEVEKEKQIQEAKAKRERLVREKEMQPKPEPKQYTQAEIDNMTDDQRAEYEGRMGTSNPQYVAPAGNTKSQQVTQAYDRPAPVPSDVQAGDNVKPELKKAPVAIDANQNVSGNSSSRPAAAVSDQPLTGQGNNKPEGQGLQQVVSPSDQPAQNPNHK